MQPARQFDAQLASWMLIRQAVILARTTSETESRKWAATALRLIGEYRRRYGPLERAETPN